MYRGSIMAERKESLADAISRDLLPFIQNPAQYIDGEVGAVRNMRFRELPLPTCV